MFYIYRFTDEDDNIIYVGKTNNIKNRMSQHFGGAGHLPKACYDNVEKVEFAIMRSKIDMDIMEIYFINKWKPIFNSQNKRPEDIELIVTMNVKWMLLELGNKDIFKTFLDNNNVSTSIYTISELAKLTNIPDSTCRRYLNIFSKFFVQVGGKRVKKYDGSAVNLIKQIKNLYDQGLEINNIDDVLSDGFPELEKEVEYEKFYNEELDNLKKEIRELKVLLTKQLEFNKVISQQIEILNNKN